MRIVITGNMGYVGPALVRHLRETWPDAQLVGIDVGYFGHCLTTRGPLPEHLLDVQHFADVRSLPAELLRGADAVVYLAAISNDPMGNAFEAVTDAVNREAAVATARMAREAGAKAFVFASSCSVYGHAEGDSRSEGDPLNPLTAYARSKIAAEQELETVAGADFRVTCLRFPTACGMSDRLRLDLVLNDFVAAAVASGCITVLSDGTPWRPLIDVRDMARGMEWAIGRDRADGGEFLAINVGRGNINYQVRDVAVAVRDAIPGTDLSINTEAAPDQRSYRVNFSRYETLAPDHLPRLSLEESIARVHAGLVAVGFADAEFRQSTLIRLNEFTRLRESGILDENLHWQENVEVPLSTAR